jgi:hypothetical protein
VQPANLTDGFFLKTEIFVAMFSKNSWICTNIPGLRFYHPRGIHFEVKASDPLLSPEVREHPHYHDDHHDQH